MHNESAWHLLCPLEQKPEVLSRPVVRTISGQTLLLLVDDPAHNEKPDAARSQYLLMMTPEHIPQKEEDEAASVATPQDSLDAATEHCPPER